MSYTPPDKTLAEFTEAEREELIAELKKDYTPEEWEKLTNFAYLLNKTAKNFRDWASSPEIQATRAGIIEMLESLRDEIAGDPETANIPFRELVNSGKFDEIIDRVSDRTGSTITPEEIRESLPTLTSIIPQHHVIPNNKAANNWINLVDAGYRDLRVAYLDTPQEITSRTIVSYEGDKVTLSSRQPFTEYDRSVADAVTSLYLYGHESHVVTAASVYRAMVHATEGETPSPQQVGAVTKSLDKMRFVRVQIDCTEELKDRHISLNGEQITRGKIDTYLLALEKLEVSTGGKVVSAYKILKAPILYEYSHLLGQVITVPAALLDVRDKQGGKVANTEQRIVIRSYLLRRVAVMKGKTADKQSRFITYESLFSDIDEVDPTPKRKLQIREYVQACLEHFKREGYVKGYREKKKGRAFTGVEIIL